jgi:hypothetical protein
MLCVLAAATSVGFSSSRSAAHGDRLQAVKVCGVELLDRRAGVCKRDERGSALLSSAFHCSARARADSGERFAGRMLYRGVPFPAYGTAVGDKRKGVNVFVTAGPYPLPGGPWACQLRVGSEQVNMSFRSAGPVGPILYVLVCRASRTAAAGPTRVCVRDESATAFSPTDAIVCSAVFAGGKGALAGIAFLHKGTSVFDRDFELPLPITAAGPQLDPDPKLASGSWACRWTVAGRVVAVKPFRVAS